MASPHVAGLMAALISRPQYADYSPAQLKKLLAKIGTKGIIRMGFIPRKIKIYICFLFYMTYKNSIPKDQEHFDFQ